MRRSVFIIKRIQFGGGNGIARFLFDHRLSIVRRLEKGARFFVIVSLLSCVAQWKLEIWCPLPLSIPGRIPSIESMRTYSAWLSTGESLFPIVDISVRLCISDCFIPSFRKPLIRRCLPNYLAHRGVE